MLATVRSGSIPQSRSDTPMICRALPHPADALEIKARLARWLEPGVWRSRDETRVVSLAEGFDFLGFNVRRYGTKPLIKPSNGRETDPGTAPRRAAVPARSNAIAVIKRLNPIIRGSATYSRHRSPAVFDYWITTCGSSPTVGDLQPLNKPSTWVPARYFGRSTSPPRPVGVRHRDSGSYLHRFGWTSIVRHQRVKHGASPDDPALTEYWAGDDARSPCRSTTPACGSTKSRKAAA